MVSGTKIDERNLLLYRSNQKAAGRMLILMILLMLQNSSISLAAQVKQQSFPTAEAAVTALERALASKDSAALSAIFGPHAEEIASSGDPVADQVEKRAFLTHFAEKHVLKPEATGKMILYIGKNDWPFPIPLKKMENGWRFDTEEGGIEILARRIGRNELNAIQVCLAIVDAQREYVSVDRNGDGLREYAQHLSSDPGTKDGLYWVTGQGEDQSPLGPLVAEAQQTGYIVGEPGKNEAGQPIPYHGYYYRILKAQGKSASGGAYDYMVGDRMIGGFALVAYPAEYASSGIMTFITNHDGVVFQKDLGKETETIARTMTLFDPDDTWTEVTEKPSE